MSCTDAISVTDDDVVIRVFVHPGSSQSVFPSGYNSWRRCIEIQVQSQAKDNKANSEVIKIIAEFFKISTQDVSIVSGQKSKEKIISVKNLHTTDACKSIEESLHGL